MSLNGDALAAAVKAAIDAEDPKDSEESMDAYRLRILKAQYGALVTYLTANTVVTVTSVSGVTPGVGASGAGTGTIS